MRQWIWRLLLKLVLVAVVGAGSIPGCDSGEKVVDEVTGNRAVKQYRKIGEDVEKLEKQQIERYESILEGEEEEQGEE